VSRRACPSGRSDEFAGADRLAGAPLSWLTTVRPDGRPHVTPVINPGVFIHAQGTHEAWVFGVTPTVAFGFGKDPYSQTRWTFTSEG
jgi:hypothetical protein